jgi:hypothetical protein
MYVCTFRISLDDTRAVMKEVNIRVSMVVTKSDASSVMLSAPELQAIRIRDNGMKQREERTYSIVCNWYMEEKKRMSNRGRQVLDARSKLFIPVEKFR